MVTMLLCIFNGGSVSSCYQGSAFASEDESLQRRMLATNLVEEYELLTGNYFTSQLSPNSSVLELLEEIMAQIGGNLFGVIQRLQVFMGRAAVLIDYFLATDNLNSHSDALRAQFISKLTPTADSTFELGRTEWGGTLPPDSGRFYAGEVFEFAQRFISFGCLAPNGGLFIVGCDHRQGVGDIVVGRSRIMDLYDWAPIWAPSGSRRLATNTDDSQGRKVMRRYHHGDTFSTTWNTPDTISGIMTTW